MDLPTNERPRERLMRYGADTLSNAELLAIILRTGTRKEDIVTLSNKIIKESGGLNGLLNMNFDEFMELHGIVEAKAAQLIALSELSKRFKSYRAGDVCKITQPKDAADYVIEDMKSLNVEHLKVIMLNT